MKVQYTPRWTWGIQFYLTHVALFFLFLIGVLLGSGKGAVDGFIETKEEYASIAKQLNERYKELKDS